jgi:N6-adenosine-specific RNA methylase IME4
MVEQVSPGPYLELFARRARFGWDYWGDESLNTAEFPRSDASRQASFANTVRST